MLRGSNGDQFFSVISQHLLVISGDVRFNSLHTNINSGTKWSNCNERGMGHQ
jgi:hypothetical protein